MKVATNAKDQQSDLQRLVRQSWKKCEVARIQQGNKCSVNVEFAGAPDDTGGRQVGHC